MLIIGRSVGHTALYKFTVYDYTRIIVSRAYPLSIVRLKPGVSAISK